MEIRKIIKNKYYIFCFITTAICFWLGYILLASLDKITNPTIIPSLECLYFQCLLYRHFPEITKIKTFYSIKLWDIIGFNILLRS